MSRPFDGPEQGQHQIWAAGYAPDTQRLAEILVVAVVAEGAGGVEQTGHAKRGVDHEAAERDAGALALALQRVVGEDHRRAQVGQEVGDRAAGGLGGHEPVAAGDGLEEPGVEEHVEAEDRPVNGLDRVGDLLARCWRLGRGTAGHASDQDQRTERSAPAAP